MFFRQFLSRAFQRCVHVSFFAETKRLARVDMLDVWGGTPEAPHERRHAFQSSSNSRFSMNRFALLWRWAFRHSAPVDIEAAIPTRLVTSSPIPAVFGLGYSPPETLHHASAMTDSIAHGRTPAGGGSPPS
jgi:hypothetical protein